MMFVFVMFMVCYNGNVHQSLVIFTLVIYPGFSMNINQSRHNCSTSFMVWTSLALNSSVAVPRLTCNSPVVVLVHV